MSCFGAISDSTIGCATYQIAPTVRRSAERLGGSAYYRVNTLIGYSLYDLHGFDEHLDAGDKNRQG